MLCDTNYVHDHSRHLKAVIAQIAEEGPRDNLVHSLLIELKFALVNSINYRSTPLYVKRDGKLYMMIYTIHDEMMDQFPDWSHSHYPFYWYLEMLHAPAYFYLDDDGQSIRPCDEIEIADGILFDAEDIGFVMEGELLESAKEFLEIDRYSALELKEMFDSLDNSRLEELLDESPKDWDAIIPEIGRSAMLFMIDLKDTDDDEYGEMFSMFRINPYGYEREVSLSTVKDTEKAQYASIVSFMGAVNHTLKFGFTGLTITTSSGEVFMSRPLLVDKYELIEKHCDDMRLRNSYESIFKL